MIFEVGKTYQHSTGDRMTIIGRLKTHIYGDCLIGERDTGELVPVGGTEANTVNWHEVESPIVDKQKQANDVLDDIEADIKEWYWQTDRQALAKDPCMVDVMIDLFIQTIDKYREESEN